MNKVIYLITTKNCNACRIQNNLTGLVLEEHKDIEFKVYDFSEVPDWIKTNVILTDFPTTVLIKDNVIKYHFVGTMSIRKMELLLKELDF